MFYNQNVSDVQKLKDLKDKTNTAKDKVLFNEEFNEKLKNLTVENKELIL